VALHVFKKKKKEKRGKGREERKWGLNGRFSQSKYRSMVDKERKKRHKNSKRRCKGGGRKKWEGLEICMTEGWGGDLKRPTSRRKKERAQREVGTSWSGRKITSIREGGAWRIRLWNHGKRPKKKSCASLELSHSMSMDNNESNAGSTNLGQAGGKRERED